MDLTLEPQYLTMCWNILELLLKLLKQVDLGNQHFVV